MKRQIGTLAVLAAGVVAGPIATDAHAQSAVTIVDPIGVGQYITVWSPPSGLTVTAGGTVTFADPGPLDHTVQSGTQPLRGSASARRRPSPRRSPRRRRPWSSPHRCSATSRRSRSLTGGTRYRVLLEVVDDTGNVTNRTVYFTGSYR